MSFLKGDWSKLYSTLFDLKVDLRCVDVQKPGWYKVKGSLGVFLIEYVEALKSWRVTVWNFQEPREEIRKTLEMPLFEIEE